MPKVTPDAADKILMRAGICPIFFGEKPDYAEGDQCEGHWYPKCRCETGCEEAHAELGGKCWCHAPRVPFRIRGSGEGLRIVEPGRDDMPLDEILRLARRIPHEVWRAIGVLVLEEYRV